MDTATSTSIDLTILVISFNTCELTCQCLRSVYAETVDTEFEVIVVDNDSQDGSADAIEAEFPQVRLIRSPENLGFAVANNLAATHARGRHLLLLNSDTIVLDGAIDRLHRFATDAGRALCGGRTVFPDHSPNPTSCWGKPTLWSELCNALGLASRFPNSRLFDARRRPESRLDDIDIVTGCFLMLPTELWRELDGFDTRFFMYGEDFDLSLRALRLGAETHACADATIVHYGGASDGVRAPKMIKLFRALAQLYTKHWGPGRAWIGKKTLDLWAFSRLFAFSVLRFVRPRFRESFASWCEIWRERRSWHRDLFGEPVPMPELAPGDTGAAPGEASDNSPQTVTRPD